MGWHDLLKGQLMDTHPPLYQAVLKLWILLFGNGEVATRLLGAIFALTSLAVLSTYQRWDTRGSSILIPAAILFFASSWLFAFYAQTARSYALVLLLSTLSIVLTLRKSGGSRGANEYFRLFVLLALSLTHYFGLLFAIAILVLDAFRYPKPERKILTRLVLSAMLAVWPMSHFLYGSIAERTGGNFRIESSGPASTLRAAMEGLLAPLIVMLKHFGLVEHDHWIYFIALGLIISVAGAFRLADDPSSKMHKDALFLCYVIFFYVLGIALIDLHTPISGARMYIVLLPAFSILFGYLVALLWTRFSLTWQRTALILCVTAYLGNSGAHTFSKMQILRYPQENWKALAAAVEDSELCRPRCLFLANNFDPALYGYYFDHSMGEKPRESIRSLEELLALSGTNHKPIIGYMMQFQLDELRLHFQGWQCLQPSQYYENKVVLLAPPGTSDLGLARCF